MENDIINIFIVTSKGEAIIISVSKNETIASAKEKYYNKVGSRLHKLWSYDGAALKDNQTFSDVKMEDKDVVRADAEFEGGGDFGVSMANISNKRGLVEGKFSKNANDWNIITTGLNVSGICNNDKCRAYKKLVDCQIGLGTFDLVRDADRIKCPICKEEMEPNTCCFSKCQYKFEGKKKINGKTEFVKSEWKKVEKDYDYYDPVKSGIVNWLMLVIETKRL